MCKSLESMVSTRLVHYIEHNNILTTVQSGFRKHHCTTDHLVKLQTHVNQAFHKGKRVGGVFIDIEKAYDMVWCRIIS